MKTVEITVYSCEYCGRQVDKFGNNNDGHITEQCKRINKIPYIFKLNEGCKSINYSL